MPDRVQAQNGGIIWGDLVNISRSPDNTSTDPFLLADPTGIVHLFWAEKTSQQPTNNPDTLMYARWDGNNWSQPVDIYYAPESDGNQIVQFPHADLDKNGTIHLVWMTQPNFPNYALLYSSVSANKAWNASAWKTPVILANDLTGTNYGVDIKTDQSNNLHIVYARVHAGDNAQDLRTVSYLRSIDTGITWQDPYTVYTFPDSRTGASNTRLIVDEQGDLFSTWSEWDQSGNGQAILFSRSMDNGISWEKPLILTKRVGNEYERDWNSIALIDKGYLVSFFEGGWRAYRNVMYSFDGGQTWTEPVDAFPGIIGENGFIEYCRDGAGKLHIFFANRTREGNTLQEGEGLWHSVWQGDEYWSEPKLSTPNINMLNPKAVIMNGNQVMTTWYTGADREIMVMAGKIVDAPELPPVSWPTVTPSPTPTLTLEPTYTPEPTLTPTEAIASNELTPTPTAPESIMPSSGVVVGTVATILVVLGILIISRLVISKRS